MPSETQDPGCEEKMKALNAELANTQAELRETRQELEKTKEEVENLKKMMGPFKEVEKKLDTMIYTFDVARKMYSERCKSCGREGAEKKGKGKKRNIPGNGGGAAANSFTTNRTDILPNPLVQSGPTKPKASTSSPGAQTDNKPPAISGTPDPHNKVPASDEDAFKVGVAGKPPSAEKDRRAKAIFADNLPGGLPKNLFSIPAQAAQPPTTTIQDITGTVNNPSPNPLVNKNNLFHFGQAPVGGVAFTFQFGNNANNNCNNNNSNSNNNNNQPPPPVQPFNFPLEAKDNVFNCDSLFKAVEMLHDPNNSKGGGGLPNTTTTTTTAATATTTANDVASTLQARTPKPTLVK